jgi:hypothetical protein
MSSFSWLNPQSQPVPETHHIPMDFRLRHPLEQPQGPLPVIALVAQRAQQGVVAAKAAWDWPRFTKLKNLQCFPQTF